MTEPQTEEGSVMIRSLINAYTMKIENLREEIKSYSNDENIWKVADGITNSGGNLCLHLVGNLNHFIGAMLGNTGYVRERDLEFSDTAISKDELLHRVDEVRDVVSRALAGLSEEDLARDYPEMLMDKQLDTGMVLAYMSGHLSYHLGQINYHRRLLDR